MEHYVIMGIDQSLTGSGVVIMAGEKLLYHTVIKSNVTFGDTYHRVHLIAQELVEIAVKYKPTLFRIEGVALQAKGHVADLGGLQHVIINRLVYGCDMAYEVITPASLKRLATGHGGATKWDMLEALPEKIQETFSMCYKFGKWGTLKPTGNGFDATDAYHLATNSFIDEQKSLA